MNNTKRTALGRGLGAILPSAETEPFMAMQPAIQANNKINIAQIEANPFQPRTTFEEQALRDLADSIKLHGIIQPITVRKLNADTYQLISGERRLKASKIAGLTEIPAYIIEADNQAMLELAIIENVQRENLNAIEIAISYKRLIEECQLKQDELGERVSKDRSTVANYLRLLKLPPEIQAGIRDNLISMGHARALVNVNHIENQLLIFREILKNQLSVRKAEELVRKLNNNERVSKDKIAPQLQLPLYMRNIQDQLCSKLETKVAIKTKGEGKGEIIIPYLSNEDLNRILDLIGE